MNEYKGVSAHSGKYRAVVCRGKRRINAGNWPTPRLAALATESYRAFLGLAPLNDFSARPRDLPRLKALALFLTKRTKTSSYLGVYYFQGLWRTCIHVDGRSRGLGLYSDVEAAARAYDAAVRFYHPGRPTNFEGTEAHSFEDILRTSRALRAEDRELTSKYIGVCWKAETASWVAQIEVNGSNLHLGYFTSEAAAARAYDDAARHYHDRPQTNF